MKEEEEEEEEGEGESGRRESFHLLRYLRFLLRGRQGWSERVHLVGIPPTLFSQGNIRARNPVCLAFGPARFQGR